MIDQQLINALRRLGLTEYEARAYVAIIELGRAEASEIAKRSGVPRTRIYDILSRLEHNGLIQKIRESRPALYTAIPPERSLEPLRRRLFDEISQALDRLRILYESSKTVSKCNVLLLRGSQVYETGMELLDRARENILARIVYLPREVFDEFIDKLRACRQRKIKIYLSMDLRLLRDEIPLDRLERILEEFDGRAFSPPMPFSFLASDFRELLILYVNPGQPRECYGFFVQELGEASRIMISRIIKRAFSQDLRSNVNPDR
ncbi:MAG: TrmB family transcriptional regulator [Thaumarchaeota archaeon]|nr:TrmB family transcriptional regulator [Nitrososphaerota archaeon]